MYLQWRIKSCQQFALFASELYLKCFQMPLKPYTLLIISPSLQESNDII